MSLSDVAVPINGDAVQREVSVRDRRTAFDYAHVLRELADVHFPSADKILLVQDNLNTHNEMSLYKTFPTDEARCSASPLMGTATSLSDIERSATSLSDTEARGNKPFS